MPLKRYLLVMAIANAGLWVAWALVVLNLDPVANAPLALVLFYGSFALASAGTLSLLGFGLRALFFRRTPLFRHLVVAHRQGALLALAVTAAFLLQAQRLVAWWSIALLVVITTGLEYLFSPRARP